MNNVGIEEQQRQRYYEHLYYRGLYPFAHAPNLRGGINMGKKKGKKEETTPVAPATTEPTTTAPVQQQALTDEQVLATMQALKAEKGADFAITSTVIRDAFNLPNRAAARSIMRRLAAAGKVNFTETDGDGKRKQFKYELV